MKNLKVYLNKIKNKFKLTHEKMSPILWKAIFTGKMITEKILNKINVKNVNKNKLKKIAAATTGIVLISTTGTRLLRQRESAKTDINNGLDIVSDILKDKLNLLTQRENDNLNHGTKGIHMTGLFDDITDADFVYVDFSAKFDENGNILELNTNQELVEKAINEGKEVGYIFNVTSNDQASMYLGIDILKNMLEKNNVNYPIIYNLCNLYITGNNDDVQCNYIILKEFIKKMQENNCYVMIGGNINQLDDMKSRFENDTDNTIDYESIDKFVMGRGTLTEYADYCMTVESSQIDSKYDYASYIELNKMNEASNFKNNYAYEVKDDDTLDSIALEYDFDKYNIIKYNALHDENNIQTGMHLYLPNQVDMIQIASIRNDESDNNVVEQIDENIISDEETLLEVSEEVVSTNGGLSIPGLQTVDTNIYYRGIDISSYQTDINWDELEKHVDYVILRVGSSFLTSDGLNFDHTEEDCTFDEKIKECNDRGIPVGVYYYSLARTEEENKAEMDLILNKIKDYNITLPVYRDIESLSGAQLDSGDPAQIQNQVNLTKQFCETMEAAGYPSGLYVHKKHIGCFEPLEGKYSIWACGGYYYTIESSFYNMPYAYEDADKIFTLDNVVNIFQVSSCCLASEIGINYSSGNHVDCSYVEKSFVDNLIRKYDKDGKILEKRG